MTKKYEKLIEKLEQYGFTISDTDEMLSVSKEVPQGVVVGTGLELSDVFGSNIPGLLHKLVQTRDEIEQGNTLRRGSKQEQVRSGIYTLNVSYKTMSIAHNEGLQRELDESHRVPKIQYGDSLEVRKR